LASEVRRFGNRRVGIQQGPLEIRSFLGRRSAGAELTWVPGVRVVAPMGRRNPFQRMVAGVQPMGQPASARYSLKSQTC
jgi:hypothetical protein